MPNLPEFFAKEANRMLIERINRMQTQIDELKSQIHPIWITKNTTGQPSVGQAGMFVENTVDNDLHAYVDGAWLKLTP